MEQLGGMPQKVPKQTVSTSTGIASVGSNPFACGLLPRVNRERAVSDVVALADDALLARCFLETKQYDHKTWPAFAQRQKSALLTASESKWDDRWLRDLHLFNVVIKDAAQCSVHMAILDANVDLDQFFQTLVGNQKESLSKLLSAYATQDAAAAFRLAEVSNLDLATEFPEIVVANSDQAPFLALVIERAMGQPTQIEQWAALLTESALRSRVVAKSISRMRAADSLKDRLASIPRHRRWFRNGVLGETLYTQLLTIALNSPNINKKPFVYLNVLKPLRAPGAMWINPRILPLCLMAAWAAAVAAWSVIYKGLILSPAYPPFVLVISLYLMIPMIMATLARRRAYQMLITSRGSDLELFMGRLPKEELPSLVRANRLVLRWLYFLGMPSETRNAFRKMQHLRSGHMEGTLQKSADS